MRLKGYYGLKYAARTFGFGSLLVVDGGLSLCDSYSQATKGNDFAKKNLL